MGILSLYFTCMVLELHFQLLQILFNKNQKSLRNRQKVNEEERQSIRENEEGKRQGPEKKKERKTIIYSQICRVIYLSYVPQLRQRLS